VTDDRADVDVEGSDGAPAKADAVIGVERL
jgi:hypothetical protein